jgi:tRNA A-37 threonylcarbamoyl transferase component Bud32
MSPRLSFSSLAKFKFIEAFESAVDYLHSLALAHNDINLDNIIVKDGTPVPIDFGSTQPFGKRLQSLGTKGWYEELFFTSEKKHDTYSLSKL